LSLSSELGRVCVVLSAPRNPLNIGAAARAMSNFGFHNLRVVNAWEVSFREARSAVGAPDLLAAATEHQSLDEGVAGCTLVVGTTAGHNRDLQHTLRSLRAGARMIHKHLAKNKSNCVALLFGSEKRGLSNADLSHCHWLLTIPTREEHLSMNLGQAVAVCLYELSRARVPHTSAKAATSASVAPASADDLERMTALLIEVLRASGYISAQSAEEKIRRMVHRLDLTAPDIELWLGILRRVAWKLHSL
jgi:TrmH family RNA methyltransferase